MAMVAAGFTGGQAEELRRAMGFKRSEKRMKQIEAAAARGHGAAGHHRRRRRADHHVDHVVRALRVSRVARRELRAARLRERVPEGALPGGVLHGAAQQPADGVLPPGDAGEGRAAARRAISRRSTCRSRTGTARSKRTAASASACATSRACASRSAARWPPRADRLRRAPPALLPEMRRATTRSLLECVPAIARLHRSTAALHRSWSCFCNLCAHDWTAPRPQPRASSRRSKI